MCAAKRQRFRYKISPSLSRFLAGPKTDVRDLIVILDRERIGLKGAQKSVPDVPERVKAVESRSREFTKRVREVYEDAAPRASKRLGDFHFGAEEFLPLPALGIASAPATPEMLEAFARDETVSAIIPNHPVTLIQPESKSLDVPKSAVSGDGATWGVKQVGAESFWREGIDGKGVTIGVIDTGVYGDHPALEGKVKQFAVFDPGGREIKAMPTFDVDDHGTHVCGTIAGSANGQAIGVAPGARLVVASGLLGPVKSLMFVWITAMVWAAKQGASVINMSIGIPTYEPMLESRFTMFSEEYDVVVVASIGNSFHGSTSGPANLHSALGIGATAADGMVAPFSSGAALLHPLPKVDTISKPDIVAPGVDVYSSVPPYSVPSGHPPYKVMSGTSMAAPHVSGVIALLRQTKPAATAPEIIDALRKSARHPDPGRRPDSRHGWGELDPREALKLL